MDEMITSEQIKNLITDKISGEWGKEAILGEGVKIIRTANFTNLGVINYDKVVYRNIDEKKINQKKLKKGDIIIEKSGGSPNQPVGRVVYFDLDTQEDYLCNNFTTILRPDKNKVYPKYLFYQLFISHIKGKTLKYQNKTTGIINLKLDNYLNERINILTLEDQIRIATILGKAEALIKQRKESIALLDEFLKSTFLEMFGDPLRNEKGWEKKRLKKLVNIENSKRIPVKQADRNLREGIYPYYGATGIIDTIDAYKFDGTYLLIAEDGKNLLFRQKNNAFLAKGKFWVNNHAHVLSFNGLSNLRYLEFYLNNINLQPYLSGTDQIKLNREALERILISTPSIELQNQFAQIVEKTEASKKQYQASLEGLEQLFGSLSQKAFKGELDLSKIEIEEEIEEEENIDGGFISNEEAEPIIKILQNDVQSYLNSLPPIKSKDRKIIKEIENLDLKKKQEGSIKFDEDYAKYRVLDPLFETEELKSFSEIYDALKSFKDITYAQAKEFVFKGLTDEKAYFEQVFDIETKEIRHKLLL